MPAYDVIMLIVLTSATIFGAIKGFAWQIASLASILVSYLVAYYFRLDVAKMINAQPPWNLFIAMLVLYSGTSFVIWMVFRLISGTIDKVKLKDFDRHMGALFGFGKGVVFCLLITMFAMTLLGPAKQQAICSSKSGFYLSKILSGAKGIFPREIDDVIGPHLRKLEEQLEQGVGTNYVSAPNGQVGGSDGGSGFFPSGNSDGSMLAPVTGGSLLPGAENGNGWNVGNGILPSANRDSANSIIPRTGSTLR